MDFKIAICGNDLQYLIKVKNEIVEWFIDKINIEINIFTNGLILLDESNKFNLIILDTKISYINGLELKEKLEKKNLPIIYLSDEEEYMRYSFGKQVYAFIKKDDLMRLKTVINKVIDNSLYKYILLSGKSININSILYAKADGVYTEVYLDNEVVIIRKSLKDFLIQLNSISFFRIHRSYIINFKAIKLVKNNYIILTNGKHIPISKNKYNEFIESYLLFLNKSFIK